MSACSGPAASDATDGGSVDGAIDASSDTSPDGASPDPEDCPAGTHLCDDVCAAAQPNDPSVGCALGCNVACLTPDNGTAGCTEDGLCTYTCPPGAAEVDGQCVPFDCYELGYNCGVVVDRAGNELDCDAVGHGCTDGATCVDNVCDVAPDHLEPNDSPSTATQLGELDDADNVEVTYDGLTIDSTVDADWFQFHIVDGLDLSDPDIYVKLVGGGTFGWLYSPHEISVWFRCDADDEGTEVECGEWADSENTNNLDDPTLGVGCSADGQYGVWGTVRPTCATTTDSGTVTVRVRKPDPHYPPSGDPYALYISVD